MTPKRAAKIKDRPTRVKATRIPKIEMPNGFSDKELNRGHFVKEVRGLTNGQKKYLEILKEKKISIILGPQGSGKSCISMRYGAQELKRENYKKMVIIKPYIGLGPDIGLLPGDINDKYKYLVKGMLEEFINVGYSKGDIQTMIEKDIIEICPIFFCLGRSFNYSYVHVDEISNCTITELELILTRTGRCSKVCLNGCMEQSSLPVNQRVDLRKLGKLLSEIDDVGFLELTNDDIVRDDSVRKILEKLEEYK